MTSATDYAILQNEANVNGGQAPIYADPYNLIDANGNSIKGFGTDWQDLVFYDNAPVVNHDVTVSGASEKVIIICLWGIIHKMVLLVVITDILIMTV